MEAVYWLGAVIVLLVIEIATLGLTTIWFAGGALAAAIAAGCNANLVVQIIVFVAVSVILLLFTRPIAVRYLNKDHVKTNADRFIGQEAVVLETIDNLNASGRAQIAGMEWTARAVDEKDIIESGTIVLVERIDGVKLMVRRKEG